MTSKVRPKHEHSLDTTRDYFYACLLWGLGNAPAEVTIHAKDIACSTTVKY